MNSLQPQEQKASDEAEHDIESKVDPLSLFPEENVEKQAEGETREPHPISMSFHRLPPKGLPTE
jgi:hypothetical protein